MYFDGANYKDGLGAGAIFISLEKNTCRYSLTLNLTCTNKILEYEAHFLGLKVATNHGIKKLHVIDDLELFVSQIKETYAAKNKRLK